MAVAASSLGAPTKRPDWDRCRNPAVILADLFGRSFGYSTVKDRAIAVSKIRRMLDGDEETFIDPLSADEIWDIIQAMVVAHQEALKYPDVEFDVRGVGLIPYLADKVRRGVSLMSGDRGWGPTRLPALGEVDEDIKDSAVTGRGFLPQLF